MNLGYMMIPQQYTVPSQTALRGRAGLAHEHGFSEFYAAKHQQCEGAASALSESPEQSELLRILPDSPERPAPRVITIDGKRQITRGSNTRPSLAVPSQTEEQVKSNVIQGHASLSVSWLSNTQLARHWAAHVTASTHAGLRARSEDWRVARTILICEDPARAEAAVKSNESPCRTYYSNFAEVGSSTAQIDALIDDCVLYGTLQSVLGSLRDITADSGPFGTLTLVDHAWPDAQLAQQSIALLASEIAPLVQHNRVAI